MAICDKCAWHGRTTWKWTASISGHLACLRHGHAQGWPWDVVIAEGAAAGGHPECLRCHSRIPGLLTHVDELVYRFCPVNAASRFLPCPQRSPFKTQTLLCPKINHCYPN